MRIGTVFWIINTHYWRAHAYGFSKILTLHAGLMTITVEYFGSTGDPWEGKDDDDDGHYRRDITAAEDNPDHDVVLLLSEHHPRTQQCKCHGSGVNLLIV